MIYLSRCEIINFSKNKIILQSCDYLCFDCKTSNIKAELTRRRDIVYKVMIVEDDQTIAQLIAENIEKWQLSAYIIQDFNQVDTEFKLQKPDLVLMDINLPVYDGYYWNQKIRDNSEVPIIFISSRNTNMDMVMAMNMGADDFVNKPFSMEVLMAKINALLRRTYGYHEQNTSYLEHKGLKLNLQSGDAQFGDQVINLSKNEYKLLQFMMHSPGKIISRDRLLRELWEDERFVDDNTLTVNVNRLRRKIEQVGLKDCIVTKVGQGYLIP